MIKVYMDASTKGNPGPSGGTTDRPKPENSLRSLFQKAQTIKLSLVFLKTLTILKEKGLTTETILCYSNRKC